MRIKYFGVGIITLSIMIGWNAFLIQRDAELFRAVYTQTEKN
jgi:hypothetical protein